MVANIVKTMFFWPLGSRPRLSGHLAFVHAATAIGVGAVGVTFIAGGLSVAGGTGVQFVDIPVVGPTVVCVVVATIGSVAVASSVGK